MISETKAEENPFVIALTMAAREYAEKFAAWHDNPQSLADVYKAYRVSDALYNASRGIVEALGLIMFRDPWSGNLTLKPKDQDHE